MSYTFTIPIINLSKPFELSKINTMKHFLTSLVILLATFTSFAQAPNRISYQAEVRNGSNNLVINQLVGIRISILQGSPPMPMVW